MVDSSVSSIYLTLILDIALFAGLAVGFVIYRKIRSPIINVDFDLEMRRPYINEGEYEVQDLLRRVKNMSLEEVHSAIGEWGYVYLSLHKAVAYTIGVLLTFGVLILLVIYCFGDTVVGDQFNITGIAHIIDNSELLFAPVLFLFVFSILVFGFANFYYKVVINAESEDLNPPQRNAVLITKIPRNFPPEFLDEKIKTMLVNKYGSGIVSVYTIPLYQTAYKLYLKVEEYKEKLKYFEYELKTKGTRPTMRVQIFSKVDGIDHCKEKIETLQEEIKKEKKSGIHSNSGRAYIICKNEQLVKEIIDFRVEREHVLKTEQWKFKPALNPSDIKWENFGKKSRYSTYLKVFFNLAFIGLFLILLTPTTFNTYIQDGFEEIGAGDLFTGFVGLYLPSLLLILYQQAILPEVVNFLVSQENLKSSSDEVSSGLRKYLFYQVFYTFLYPLLGLKFVDFISVFFESDVDWNDEFADSINENGQFFTIYMINETFIKNGFDLIVAGKYIKAKAKAIIATTDAERALAFQADNFKFDLELAISINALIITCSFAVVYPVILIPAFTFFYLRVKFM